MMVSLWFNAQHFKDTGQQALYNKKLLLNTPIPVRSGDIWQARGIVLTTVWVTVSVTSFTQAHLLPPAVNFHFLILISYAKIDFLSNSHW